MSDAPNRVPMSKRLEVSVWLPKRLYREAAVVAAEVGMPLDELVTEGLEIATGGYSLSLQARKDRVRRVREELRATAA